MRKCACGSCALCKKYISNARHYYRHREENLRQRREYKKAHPPTDEFRAKRREYERLHAEKKYARNTLNNTIRAGKITRGTACEGCGSNHLIEGHHDDYSKPLEVRWLCRVCHRDAHRIRTEKLLAS